MERLREDLGRVLNLDSAALAVEFEERSITWGELRGAVTQLQDQFSRLGLGIGAHVGCILRNSPHHLALLLATLTSQRCILTLNPFQPDDKVASDIERLRPPVVVAAGADWERPALRAAAARIGAAGIALTASWVNPVESVHDFENIRGSEFAVAAPETAIVMLTSGTTGPPKRIPLLGRGLERAILDAMRYEGSRELGAEPSLSGKTVIQFTSFVHIGGVFNALRAVLSGHNLYLLVKFDVQQWAAAVEKYRPTVASLPPAALRMVIDAQIAPSRLASLRAVRSGTAPLNQADADEFESRYGAPVLQNYGATEFAGGVAGWTMRDHRARGKAKRGSVGKLHDGVEARVRDPVTDAVLPLRHEGILELRGPQFPNADEWVRTTDRALIDEDRFLWIRGRSDNAITRGGFKVHPDEVVAALEGHPAIREAVVVGLADSRLGAVPVAAVILKANSGPIDPDELRAWVRGKLTPYQVPVAIHVVDDVPRTAALKPDLTRVRDLLERKMAAAKLQVEANRAGGAGQQ